MKAVKLLAAATLIVCLTYTVGFALVMYQHASDGWLKSFPNQLDSKIAEIKDIEHLRRMTAFLVNSDRDEKQAINATLDGLVQWAVQGFAVISILCGFTLFASYRSARHPPGNRAARELDDDGKS